jgi:hypothetical protein
MDTFKMYDKNYINVYWAPFYQASTIEDYNAKMDWNMLYYDPDTVYDDLKINANEENIKRSFFSCPVFSKTYKNTYVYKNTLESSFVFEKDKVKSVSRNGHVGLNIARDPSMMNSNNLEYNLHWIFFSDEPLIATFTAPYFHIADYSSKVSLIPGEFDIGQWFRPYNLEYISSKESDSFVFKENDPLFYVKFNTDKKVVLKRFNLNEKLYTYGVSSKNSPLLLESSVSLSKRYKRFNQSRMKDIVLSEIKKNLVDL